MAQTDRFPQLKRVHHVEFWVGNARQAAYYYRQAFGFSQVAYAGLETGQRDLTSYALAQGEVRFVVTTPMSADHPASEHVRRHGDGVRDIAFEVEDVDQAFGLSVERGAEPAVEPHSLEDRRGTVRHAAIRAFGDTLHSFYSRKDYRGAFLPGFEPLEVPGHPVGLQAIDHIVGNVEMGSMEHWADWYHRVLGLERYLTQDDKDSSTEHSSLRSVVMSNEANTIRLALNEPAEGLRKSQIQEYLEAYEGPGVQHIALRTDDAVATVEQLTLNGVEFLRVPDEYYDALPGRAGAVEESIDALRDLGLLVDRDEEGYLLQCSTKPIQDRPTLFLEIVQRRGSRGFGQGNFRALFESIEAEQARRGNP